MKKNEPTCPTVLRLMLSINLETGDLKWKPRPAWMFKAKATGRGKKSPEALAKSWNDRFAGSSAFTRKIKGYPVAEVYSKQVRAHRVIWAIHYGAWPKMDIDHNNRDRSDNRIANLRLATKSQNMHNITVKDERKRGAYFDKRRGTWFTMVRQNGRLKYYGPFSGKDEASAAYRSLSAAIFGEFTPV